MVNRWTSIAPGGEGDARLHSRSFDRLPGIASDAWLFLAGFTLGCANALDSPEDFAPLCRISQEIYPKSREKLTCISILSPFPTYTLKIIRFNGRVNPDYR